MRVSLFGPQAAAVGAAHVELDLAPPCRCAQVRDALRRTAPALANSLDAARLAVNHRFAPEDHLINTGDEVALIALVSGG